MKEILLAVTYILVFRFVVCQPCTRTQSLNVTDGELHVNGSLTHSGVLYNSGSWYEVQEDGGSTRYGCPCIDRVCLWKCCSANAAFHNRTCNESSLDAVNPFSPEVYKGKEVTSVVAHQHFFYVYGRPCNESYLVDSASSSEELHLQENGTLYEVASGHNQWHASGGYCLDMMVTNVSQGPRLVASVCFPEESVTDDSYLLYTAYAIGLILSAPFLLATFLVYALVPELRNLHGLCLMAYCAGLIVAFPFLAYLKLHIGRIGVAMTGCLTVAFIVYYAFQTSFFWLNIMCFDIWRTFSNSYRGGGMTKKRERKRFAMYAVYAWGMPLVLTAVTVAMQFSDLPSDVITPGFGTRRCWFVDWLSSVLYFYTPVLILVVCNVVLFSVTANRIRTIRQETAILKGSESSRSDKLKKDKQRYGLYLKLFLVMGVNWTLELVSLALGGSNWYWIVTDISNVGLGVFVFFIFVWKKRVRKLVQKRCRTIFGSPDTEPDSQPKWTSSSAPTEDTRISSTDESAIRLKDLH